MAMPEILVGAVYESDDKRLSVETFKKVHSLSECVVYEASIGQSRSGLVSPDWDFETYVAWHVLFCKRHRVMSKAWAAALG
jgi:hypothetical protein